MHCGRDYFSVNGNDTLRVANKLEYGCQGEAMLGQHESLSVSDAIKLNQMYNSPGSGYGIPGHLKVHIRCGIALLHPYPSDTYQYVRVTAVDGKGKHSTYRTEVKCIITDITDWNEWIDFGARMSWHIIHCNECLE